MKISISPDITQEFPEAQIGWLRAKLTHGSESEYVASLKRKLPQKLAEIGLSADTLPQHPDIRRWRETYSKQGVKPSKYHSSIEALRRRVFKKTMWEVSDVVDCYDCVSAVNLLAMGAHDMAKLKGDMVLRHAREGEKFYPLGAGDTVTECTEKQIVYADSEKICCWLWNYRDTRDASVDENTEEALFIVDAAFEPEWRSVEQGLAALSEALTEIGCTVRGSGIVCAAKPEAEFD